MTEWNETPATQCKEVRQRKNVDESRLNRCCVMSVMCLLSCLIYDLTALPMKIIKPYFKLEYVSWMQFIDKFEWGYKHLAYICLRENVSLRSWIYEIVIAGWKLREALLCPSTSHNALLSLAVWVVELARIVEPWVISYIVKIKGSRIMLRILCIKNDGMAKFDRMSYLTVLQNFK